MRQTTQLRKPDRLSLLVIALAMLIAAPLAHGQVVKFTAQTTTGAGTVTPVLTWCTETVASAGATCTNPGPATSCTASGDWTGAKAASGTQTLPAISSSATYNLTCAWPAGTTATMTWTPPTQNTDGSAYTDQNGYVVSYGTSATTLTQSKTIASSTATSDTITGLTAGTWFFGIKARNQAGNLSALSNVASKTLAAGSAQRTVGIVVNPLPNAPTGLTVE